MKNAVSYRWDVTVLHVERVTSLQSWKGSKK